MKTLLLGTYPNFFLSLPVEKIDDFGRGVRQVDSLNGYNELIALDEVRHTDEKSWPEIHVHDVQPWVAALL